MKYRYYLLTLLTIALAVIGQSCANEREVSGVDEEGKVEVSISAAFNGFVQHDVLRAAADGSVENAVTNLYLMVFSQDDTLVHHLAIDDDEMPSNNVITKLRLLKGATYTFALVANYGEGRTIYGVSKADLYNINTLSHFEAFQVTLKKPTVQRVESALLMTGMLTQKVTSGSIEIPLKRVDAKVRFVISTENTEGNEVSFVPRHWYIRNVPKGAKLGFNDQNQTLTGDDSYLFPGRLEDNNSPLLLMEEDGNEFTFYMPPNTKETIEGQSCTDFKFRELQEKTEDTNVSGTYHLNQGEFADKFVENGDFIYADPYATYVEIVGDYTEKKIGSHLSIEGEMHYIIHLGYVNGDANNWEANSNGSYTYNVKIKGVKEVIMEVVEDKENNTAVTGDVLGYKKLELRDAPYGYGVITLTVDELSKLRDINDIGYIVRTPFSDNMMRYGNEFNTPVPATFDTDWIRFRIHGTGDPNDKILEYDPTNKGLTLEKFLKELSQPEYKTTGITFTYYLEDYYYHDQPANSTFVGDWEVNGWRTFVNQPDRYIGLFLYKNTEAGHKISRDQESQYTKVDILFRQKSIITHYSLNPTVFPINNSAFGIQALQDPYSEYTFKKQSKSGGGDNYEYYQKSVTNGPNAYYYTLLGRIPRGNSRPHMGYSTIRNRGAKGYEVTTEHLYANYIEHKAYLECMKYNRDENGNGVIDQDEIVWYLPAMYQYMTLGIGVYSLPNDHPLYPSTYPYNDFQHYVTSSRAGEQSNNAMIYHAELLYNVTEALYDPVSWPHPGAWGAAEVMYNFWKYISYVKPYRQSGKYATGNMYYRCARKLGKAEINQEGRDKVIAIESTLFKREDVGDSYKITCYLEEKSIRPASQKITQGPLPKHNERSIFNRPTRTFYVYKQTISNQLNNGNYIRHGFTPYREGEAACQTLGPQWRLPSASELSIMLMALDEREPEYHTERQLPTVYGWKRFNGNRKYNRQEDKETSNLGDETSRRIYWSSTWFSSNPSDEPDRYVYGLMGGWNHPVLSLIRPHVKADLGGKFGAQGYIRCVHDGG